MNKWVKGNPAIQTTFDGQAYYFANEEGRQMFAADLRRLVPARAPVGRAADRACHADFYRKTMELGLLFNK